MVMFTEFIQAVFVSAGDKAAVIWRDQAYTYRQLLQLYADARKRVAEDVAPGMVVGLHGDFTPQCIAMLLALIDRSAIVVPLCCKNQVERDRKNRIAQIEAAYSVAEDEQLIFSRTAVRAEHPLYTQLRETSEPGLVLFSSGTSGDPKAAVHNFNHLLEKFRTPRPALITLNFMLFDHWGGLNTLFHALSNGSMVVTVQDRSPTCVVSLIARHRIELLPTTPTFVNLLLLSGATSGADLSSLKVISYGAEPMPQSTLERLRQAFPWVKLQQTYGLIEVGVLRSKSKEDGSLWVKIGGDGYATRVVDGVLQIKTKSTILGYLNAPCPVTEDGWFITGDAVQVDGEYMRILGRKSELINVGGEKVYPTEVESVIQALPEVVDVTVYGERNPLVGNIVCANIRTREPVNAIAFGETVKALCRERLERFKVPVRICLVDGEQHGDRFKKLRHRADGASSVGDV